MDRATPLLALLIAATSWGDSPAEGAPPPAQAVASRAQVSESVERMVASRTKRWVRRYHRRVSVVDGLPVRLARQPDRHDRDEHERHHVERHGPRLPATAGQQRGRDERR